jgi:hypothetical protein
MGAGSRILPRQSSIRRLAQTLDPTLSRPLPLPRHASTGLEERGMRMGFSRGGTPRLGSWSSTANSYREMKIVGGSNDGRAKVPSNLYAKRVE